MIPESKKKLIEDLIKNKNKTNKLTFVHTPKCGGTYVAQILEDLNITNLGHNRAELNDGINFTIIRHPVERFESLLNYRLTKTNIRTDWPIHLRSVYNDETISLNRIVEKMSDKEILNFKPYRTLKFWSKNVDVFLLINELHDFLEINGYKYDIDKYDRKNISKKNRGVLNEKNRERIANLYSNDIQFFSQHNIH